MLIIDEHATAKLLHALRSLAHTEGQYAMRFYGHPVKVGPAREGFIAQAERHFLDSRLYLCEDGDAVLLAPASFKECKTAMYEVAALCGIEPAERIGELYSLDSETGALMVLLEKKLKSRHRAEETAAMRQAQQQAAAQNARKRREMLELPAVKNDLKAQRRARSAPELMIIEDDDFSRRLVDKVLAKEYRLTGLASAEQALSTYARLAPDLLFLDINLPDVTGHELLEKIIALDPDAYVVMLSGNTDKANVMQAMSRGARGFVAKPFACEKLFQYIERCMALRKETV